jgi:hypothetical protein
MEEVMSYRLCILIVVGAVVVGPGLCVFALDRSDLEWAREINETATERGEEILEQHPNSALEQDVQARLDEYNQSKLESDAEKMLRAIGTSDERKTAKELLQEYDLSKIKKDVKEIFEEHEEFIQMLKDSPELSRKERRQLREIISRVDDL